LLQPYGLDPLTKEGRDRLWKENNLPTRAISLMWNQRSVDTFLGLPFNIASYGLLLEIIAKTVNMVPDELIGNLGDVHLYSNHIEQAKEQIGREMTWEEQVQWVMRNTDVEMENLYIVEEIAKDTTPKHTRQPYPLPRLKLNPIFLANLEHKGFDEAVNGQVNFELENYQSHPAIKAPLSN
jgi:thymidylate synthase